LICRAVNKKALWGVGHELREYVPDSGQEHTANGNSSFLVTTMGFDSAIAILEFRVLVRFDKSIYHLNEERLDVGTGARDTSGFHLAATLVVAGTTTCPRAQMLGRRKHGHIRTDFRNEYNV
jgi:hypothetical protein